MLQAFSKVEKTVDSSDSKIPVGLAGKDAVIDVEQVELSEFSVSLKKRLSKTLAPLVQLTFYGEGSEGCNIEMRDKNDAMVFRINSSVQGSSCKSLPADSNNNNNDECCSICRVSFQDEIDSTVFTATIHDEIVRIQCGTEDIGSVEHRPFQMIGRDAKGNVIFTAEFEHSLFKKSTEPKEILINSGEEAVGKLGRDDSGALGLTFLEEMNFDNKAILLTAAYVLRSTYYCQRVTVVRPESNCCGEKIMKIALASAAALATLATVTVLTWPKDLMQLS